MNRGVVRGQIGSNVRQKNRIVFPWELGETVRLVMDKAKEQSVPIEKAKETLAHHGYDLKQSERSLKEVAGKKSREHLA